MQGMLREGKCTMVNEIAFKMGFALLMGLLIGLDRELKHKPLGIKTSMIIAVASCLLTMVSIHGVERFSIPGKTTMDPLRLAAQVVSGVGFIGAGVILRRSNEVISGLTTAAMVWGASALGIATGAGFYIEAGIASSMMILAVSVVPFAVKLIGPAKLRQREVSVHVVMNSGLSTDSAVENLLNRHDIRHIKIKDLGGEQKELQFLLFLPAKHTTTDIYQEIKKLDHVARVQVESVGA